MWGECPREILQLGASSLKHAVVVAPLSSSFLNLNLGNIWMQLAMGWEAAGFTDAAAAALADDGADRDTLVQVAAARGLSMPP